jgi:hypothetical protein
MLAGKALQEWCYDSPPDRGIIQRMTPAVFPASGAGRPVCICLNQTSRMILFYLQRTCHVLSFLSVIGWKKAK